MISKEYDKFKQNVLNKIASGGSFVVSNDYGTTSHIPLIYDLNNCGDIRSYNARVNCVGWSDPDHDKKLSEAQNPRFKVGSLPSLYDTDGVCYNSDLLLYNFKENLICGTLNAPAYDEVGEFDRYCSHSTFKDGLMIVGSSRYLLDGFTDKSHSRYYKYAGTLCVEKVDDDGIIVLPPPCTGVCLLDEGELQKIKKIIIFVSSEVYPHLYLVSAGSLVSMQDVYSVTYRDVSHIVCDVHVSRTSLGLQCFNEAYHSSYPQVNNHYAYQFKEINVFYEDKEDFERGFTYSYLDTPVNIYDDFGTSMSLTMFNKGSVTLHGSTTRVDIAYHTDGSVYNLQNIKMLLLESSRSHADDYLTSVLSALSSSLSPGMIVYYCDENLNAIECNDAGIFVFDSYMDHFSSLESQNIKVYWTDKKDFSRLKSIELSDLYRALVGKILVYSYGKRIITLDDIDSLKYKSQFLSIINTIFGTCNSTYGELTYVEACEKFCQNNEPIIFSDFNILEGTMTGTCGAGVKVYLNVNQVYILHLSGLVSPNYVRLTDDSDFVFSDEKFSPENQNSRSRDSVSGVDCLVFSQKTSNPAFYLSSEDEDDKDERVAILGFISGRHPFRYNSGLNYSTFGFYKFGNIEDGTSTVWTSNHQLVYTRKGNYYFDYIDRLKRNKVVMKNSDYGLQYNAFETTVKIVNDLVSTATSSILSHEQTLKMLSFCRNSKSVGLYGGIKVTCTNCVRSTNGQLPDKLVMDVVKSDYDYSIFTIKREDTGEVYKIEKSTLSTLLSHGELVSDNLNYTLIPGEVLWLKDDYDKQATDMIESMLGAKSAFTVEDSTLNFGMKFRAGGLANTFSMTFYNIGEELALPSYITFAEEEVDKKKSIVDSQGEDAWTQLHSIGIETGNNDAVDVTKRIDSLLGDNKKPSGKGEYNKALTDSAARANHMNFYCGENAYYKSSKPLVIKSRINNDLLELPKNMSLDFCYDNNIYRNYYGYGLDEAINHPVKVVIRDGSTIYKLTSATDVDIADNCLIHEYAFSYSRLKTCVIHGGVIPSKCFYNCEDFESLVVDGGSVSIDITAFYRCPNFKGITCINNGSYKLLNEQNGLVIEDLRSDSITLESSFYQDIIDAYDKMFNVTYDGVTDVIPYDLTTDMTVKLKHRDGSESNLSLERILDMYNKGALNFSYTLKSGKTINFIEELKYSELKCLVFYPGINNDFCNYKVLLLLDTKEVQSIHSLRKCKFVFAYQEEDWKTGKITDVPLKYLDAVYKSGIYFDSSNIDDRVFLIYHFWQNLNYYCNFWDDFNSYYVEGRVHKSYLPLNNTNSVEGADIVYVPASHEYSWYYKKMDKNVSEVVVGSDSRYGRKMHNKRYVITPSPHMVLIPGIGENCTLHLKPIIANSDYDSTDFMYEDCETLDIMTETIVDDFTFVYAAEEELRYVLHRYSNLMDINIYKPTQLALGTTLFKTCNVINTTLKIDCKQTNIDSPLFQRYITDFCADAYITFEGDCKFIVDGLTVEQAKDLLQFKGFYNFVYQLIINANTYEDLMKDDTISKFMLQCKNGEIKIPRKIKKSIRCLDDITIEAPAYAAPKIENISIFGDDVEEDEKVEPDEERKEAQLAQGIIPDVMTLDYIDTHADSMDSDLYSNVLGLTENDGEVDFTSLDFMPSAADTLVDMCGVDTEALAQKQEMEDRERDEEIAVVEEYLAEEALNAQDTLLNQIKEEDKLKSEVFDDVIAEDEKKSKRKARKTAKKKFDSLEVHSSNESEAPTASESDLVPNEVQDSIFNLQRSIDEINDKPIKGLASSLLLEIAKGYIDTNNNIENKSDVIELELGRELHKNGVLVGYEVINNETGEVKRLSLKNIDSLCKNAKYNIKNKDLLS